MERSSPRFRLAWLARALGWGRNPLRRQLDRLEATCLIFLVTVAVAAIPVAASIGSIVYEQQSQRAAVEQATRHRVEGVLLDSPHTAAGAGQDPRPVGTLHAVPVRWTGPDGAPRTAEVPVGGAWGPGDVVELWLDDAGNLVSAPVTASQAAGSGVVGAVSILLAVYATCLAAGAGVHGLSVRHASRRWEREWEVVEPLWRHPRP